MKSISILCFILGVLAQTSATQKPIRPGSPSKRPDPQPDLKQLDNFFESRLHFEEHNYATRNIDTVSNSDNTSQRSKSKAMKRKHPESEIDSSPELMPHSEGTYISTSCVSNRGNRIGAICSSVSSLITKPFDVCHITAKELCIGMRRVHEHWGHFHLLCSFKSYLHSESQRYTNVSLFNYSWLCCNDIRVRTSWKKILGLPTSP